MLYNFTKEFSGRKVQHANERLEDLEYADDICLLSTTRSDKIDALVHESSKVGLKVISSKTKSIVLRTATSTPVLNYTTGTDTVEVKKVKCF